MQPVSSGPFQLRPFVHDDIPAFTDAVRESTSTVGKWMTWATSGYSADDAASWFLHCHQERERGSSHEFGIFDAASGQLVGGCGLNQFNVVNGFCNLGYWVRESWQRRGAALAAIRALTRHGFSALGLGRIEIVVAAGNSPSLSLAAKSGAVRECLARNRLKVHGQFTDAYVFSFTPPPGLTSPPERRGGAEFVEAPIVTTPLGLAADHAGLDLKRALVEELEKRGVRVREFGTTTSDSCDYPDFAHAVGRAIEGGDIERAILVCGTGVGMSIAANRHAAVRAVVCSEPLSARMARQHNDANVLCIGARVVGLGTAIDIVDAFLGATFEGGRHAARVAKINQG